jgi:hypothetical protein
VLLEVLQLAEGKVRLGAPETVDVTDVDMPAVALDFAREELDVGGDLAAARAAENAVGVLRREVVSPTLELPVQGRLGPGTELAVDSTGIEAVLSQMALGDADGVDGDVHGAAPPLVVGSLRARACPWGLVGLDFGRC